MNYSSLVSVVYLCSPAVYVPRLYSSSFYGLLATCSGIGLSKLIYLYMCLCLRTVFIVILLFGGWLCEA